jgi:hypothetical protein
MVEPAVGKDKKFRMMMRNLGVQKPFGSDGIRTLLCTMFVLYRHSRLGGTEPICKIIVIEVQVIVRPVNPCLLVSPSTLSNSSLYRVGRLPAPSSSGNSPHNNKGLLTGYCSFISSETEQFIQPRFHQPEKRKSMVEVIEKAQRRTA